MDRFLPAVPVCQIKDCLRRPFRLSCWTACTLASFVPGSYVAEFPAGNWSEAELLTYGPSSPRVVCIASGRT